MAPPRCSRCPLPSSLLRSRSLQPFCRRCFLGAFEAETLQALLQPQNPGLSPQNGHAVAVAASGGKDSTVLAHLLVRLNRQRGLGLRLALLGVDEGIWGYRDEALQVLRGVGEALPLPLVLVSHREIFGWALDEVGPALGGRSRCTVCGVFRRQAMERAAREMGADWIATGHNADDVAETVLMNFLRGDVARLRRAANEASGATNGASGATNGTSGATNVTGATNGASGATNLTGATKEAVVATNVTRATNEDSGVNVATDEVAVATVSSREIPPPSTISSGPTEADGGQRKLLGNSTESPGNPTGFLEKSTGPNGNPTEPNDDPMRPNGNPTEPLENSIKPNDDPTKLNQDPTKLSENSTKRDKNPTKLNENSTKPNQNSMKPNEDPTKVNDGPMRPLENSTRPNKNPTEPNHNSTESNEDSAEPNENPTKSNENPTKLNENPTKPNENPTKPNQNPTKPNKNPRKPNENPTKPKENPRRPKEKPGQPGQLPPRSAEPAVPRLKPLRHAAQKEIVLYAHFRGLPYASAECRHAPLAFRGHPRALLKDLEASRPAAVAALAHSGRRLALGAAPGEGAAPGACGRCGAVASGELCMACVLMAALDKGRPKVALGKRGLRVATEGGGHWEGEGGQWGGGYQDGGGGHREGGAQGCGGHGGCGCKAGGQDIGGHQDGAGGYQSTNAEGGGRGAGGHEEGGGAQGPGGPGDHQDQGLGGPGGHLEQGSGGPQARPVQVELLGRAGRSERRRLRGFGHGRRGLGDSGGGLGDIWDF